MLALLRRRDALDVEVLPAVVLDAREEAGGDGRAVLFERRLHVPSRSRDHAQQVAAAAAHLAAYFTGRDSSAAGANR